MDSSCHVSQLFSLLPAITYVNLNFHQMSWIVCSAPAAAWQIFSLGFKLALEAITQTALNNTNKSCVAAELLLNSAK